LAVLVAEKVVEVAHPFLGPDVKVRLWSPLDDEEILKSASDSTAAVTRATVKNDAIDPVICCVKKPSPDPVLATDCSGTDEGRSCNYLEQKSSTDNSQSQTGVQAVRTRPAPRQVVSYATSDVANSRSSHTSDLSVAINADRDQCGPFRVEVDLSPGLSRVLYDKHRHWLYERLCRCVNNPVDLVIGNSSDSRLAVVAFSLNTAEEGAQKLGACLLRGTVPLTDSQHAVASSAKFHKQLNKLMKSKAIDVKTSRRKIIVDGLPHDVVYAVSEIDRCLNK